MGQNKEKKTKNSLFWAIQNPYFGLFLAFLKLPQKTLISIIIYDSCYIFNTHHNKFISYITYYYFVFYNLSRDFIKFKIIKIIYNTLLIFII